ncbi:MAG: DUF4954 family protein [Spirochaetales bacterium]|nr:DUF4954 family protein [Spirochaetia bacterium]MDD7460704.1 DUF4954 family protein [Spirochaetales bacterium]
MARVVPNSEKNIKLKIDPELLKGKRNLTGEEIAVLKSNGNHSSDSLWKNIFVSEKEGCFNAELLKDNDFSGFVILGDITDSNLSYHELSLPVGISRSILRDVVTGDNCAIHNVKYLVNYRIGNRVILFNIQEMSCTNHSKFGEGLLKDGEKEDVRIWIGVGNENGNRSILPFTDLIPADAFLWSRFREDKKLMQRFVELTEYGKSKERNTFGIVEDDAVVKNSITIKDVKIGSYAYIKGALKLKNITILSSADEPSQIGEGVEMVNGIMGYGCHVFYQAAAVRFVMGRNCQLKYGARLLNSVLGDNSTVSCCELLNNLIFPFHEQHHNSSFLIASTIMGQSNIASAATIGSNHNSRSPDCEMIAGRGFWPGLCSDFKFDSRFASFVLASKGTYRNELNITYPFSLIAPAVEDNAIHVVPAYWFLYNMFAIVRNKYKFKARDRRFKIVQHIETNPLAPDSVQEILSSINRLIELTGRYLKMPESECKKYTKSMPSEDFLNEYRQKISECQPDDIYIVAKDFLHKAHDANFLLADDRCQKKYGALIYKPSQAYREYRRVLKYFAAECLMNYVLGKNRESLTLEDISEIKNIPLFTEWLNVGGQVMPCGKVQELFYKVKQGEINTWKEVHEFYDQCESSYVDYKARYALYVIEWLYSKSIEYFTKTDFDKFLTDVAFVSVNMLESSIQVREKDFTDYFRSITYRNEAEKEAVLGTIDEDGFLKKLHNATDEFETNLQKLFKNLRP